MIEQLYYMCYTVCMKSQKDDRFIAIELRKKGYSYAYIAEKTKRGKGTLSYWLAHIPYVPNNEMIDKMGKARTASGLAKSRMRLASLDNARKQAESFVGEISKRDILMLGLGLYLGEGTKTHNGLRVINANPKIIRFAIRWFREAFGVGKENFRIRLHLYPDTDIKKSIYFWSSETGLREDQFYSVHIDVRKDKKVPKKGKLPYGTAHLSVLSMGSKSLGVALFRKVIAMTDIVLEK